MKFQPGPVRREYLRSQAIVVAAAAVLMVVLGLSTLTRMNESFAIASAQAAEAMATQVAIAKVRWQAQVARIDWLASLQHSSLTLSFAGEQKAAQQLVDASELAIRKLMPEIVQTAIINPDGFMYERTLTGNQQPIIDLRDREHFQAIAVRGLDRFIGKPVIGRLSGKKTIQFASASRDAAGQLQGVIIISLDGSSFAQRSTDRNQTGIDYLILVRTDGQVIESNVPFAIDTRLDLEAYGIAPVLLGKTITFTATSPLDGVRRILTFTPIEGSDLLIGTGLDEAVAMAPGQRSQQLIFAESAYLGFIFLFVFFGVSATLYYWSRSKISHIQRIEEEQRLIFIQTLFDGAGDMIGFLDDQFHYIFANRAVSRIAGKFPSELVGTRIMTGQTEKSRVTLENKLNALEVGRSLPRFTLLVGNDVTIEVEITKIPLVSAGTISDRSGPAIGYFWIARDVTQRLRDEAELSVLRQDIELLVRTGPGTLYRAAVSPDGEIAVRFPVGLGRLAAILDQGAMNQADPVGALFVEDAIGVRAHVLQTLKTIGQSTAIYHLKLADGSARWIRDSCVVVSKADRSLEVAGYYTDVSRLIAAEQIGENTARLTRLGEMAGGLSHELNQPLAAISMAAENGLIILGRGASGIAGAQAKFEKIASLAIRAGNIIRDMRQFASVEPHHPEATSASSVVHAACAAMASKLVAVDIDLRLALEDDLPMVRATPEALEQVLVKLLANALDAHVGTARPDGSPRWIEIGATALQGGFVSLTVRDNAGGFPPDDAARIFQPFHTTKGPQNGTGLGLAVSFGLINQFGGTLTARNENDGALFEVILPVWTKASALTLV